MQIPFQDSRADGNRRWTDYKKLKRVRFFEICDLLDNCNELREPELIELNTLIENKLKSFKEIRRAK